MSSSDLESYSLPSSSVVSWRWKPGENASAMRRFISKICTRIVPLAAPVQFHSVEVSPGNFVYLIDVPGSAAKPHQYDNTYYIRLDGQTEPVPHYILEALFNQIKIPTLIGYLRIVGMRIDSNDAPGGTKIRFEIDVTIFNESKNINDTGVYIQLLTKAGRFIQDGIANHSFNDKLVFVTEASPLITYGLSTQCSFQLEISFDEYRRLHQIHKPIELMMSFGSKNSNTKRGDYEII